MILFITLLLVFNSCWSRPTEEESVVSVYTTIPTAGAQKHYDVYAQIANNLAAKLASPIYSLLGITQNKTTTERPFEHIALNKTLRPYQLFEAERDREELSPDAEKKKEDKKPEKIVLYSSYYSTEKSNDTGLDIEGEDIDDDETFNVVKPKGITTYVLEFMGSVIQLLWGGLMALLVPSTSNKP